METRKTIKNLELANISSKRRRKSTEGSVETKTWENRGRKTCD